MADRPPSSSPQGSSVLASFKAHDFYGNTISERWGGDAFEAWSYSSVGNTTPASVYDEGNGSYRVVSEALESDGTSFLFVERNALGIPGSPFEVRRVMVGLLLRSTIVNAYIGRAKGEGGGRGAGSAKRLLVLWRGGVNMYHAAAAVSVSYVGRRERVTLEEG